jgi:hypothetical protein
LIAYDVHALKTEGKKAKLNHPDDLIIDNGKNSTPKIGRTSQYKGVHLNKKTGTYQCKITLKSQRCYLGSYDLETDAAWAYDECLCQLRSLPVNFANKAEYHNARKQEAKERGIAVPCSEIKAYVQSFLDLRLGDEVSNEERLVC